MAVRCSRLTGRTNDEAEADAKGLSQLAESGRLIVTAPNLAPELENCLSDGLLTTMNSPQFQEAARKARRSLDVAAASEAREDLAGAVSSVARFKPVVEDAIRKLRA
jgi:hypothetical protein